MSPPPPASMPPLSPLTPFAVAFTAPTFRHVVVLASGTILASGRRTVATTLRAVGLGEERRFTTYHRVLNRDVWSALVLSRLMLDLLVRTSGAGRASRVGGGRDPGAPSRPEGRLEGTLPRRDPVPVWARGHQRREPLGRRDAARPHRLVPAPVGPSVPDHPDLHPGHLRQPEFASPVRDPPMANPSPQLLRFRMEAAGDAAGKGQSRVKTKEEPLFAISYMGGLRPARGQPSLPVSRTCGCWTAEDLFHEAPRQTFIAGMLYRGACPYPLYNTRRLFGISLAIAR